MIFQIIRKIQSKITDLLYLIFLSFPNNVRCNVCGWQGRQFRNDYWHPRSKCPQCYSEVRHRLLIAALSRLSGEFSFEKIVKNKKVLHFAPEKSIEKLIRHYTDDYTTADLFKIDCNLNIDISNMSNEIPDDEFDLLVACDVLEHVPEDRMAISEVYRILQKGGYAIFTVPQKDGLEKTIEDSSIGNPFDRERIFGQSDHFRIYGNDFINLLENCGFKVEVISEKDFLSDSVKKHVLFPPVLSKKPLATNHRRVFFAQKGSNNL